MKYPCAVFASLWKEHLSSNLCPIFNEWYVTMYPVSVSIFTDQWLIGPTNPLQSSLGKETWAQGFQHIWSGVLAKFWFQAKRENPWACLVEVISADRWTTWLVFFQAIWMISNYWVILNSRIISNYRTMDNMVGLFKHIISSHLLSHLHPRNMKVLLK